MTKAAKTTRALRVVIGCDTFPPDINGASRFAERLAAGLVRAGHDVHVIAPSYGKKHGTFKEVHDSSSMTVHRLKSYRVVQHKTLRYVWPFTLKSKTDRILRELAPDAVHINSHMIVGRYLMRSANQQGVRVIATNHIMPENLIKYSLVIPRWAEKVAMSLAWKDAGRVLRKADVVTTPTRKAANLLEEASGLTGVLAVSCGIEASKFANNTPTSNKEPRILYLGRLDYEKHIHNLLKAVALLPKSLKVKVEIVGDGGEREYLESLAKELGLEKRVEFRGHISDEELAKAYERATLFAMPSIAELQSIATMEAMASGRPVVAADAMALPHLVHDGDNGYLFPPDDVQAFADRLLRVLKADQQELDRLSENSLHLIQSHDIDQTIKIFEDLYQGEKESNLETADNLDTYSLPIGVLSKTLSRSLLRARARSAKLRERAEKTRDDLLAKAESASSEVRGRLEGVRDEVAFAALKFELRIRKRVKSAAQRLRVEDQKEFEKKEPKIAGDSTKFEDSLKNPQSFGSRAYIWIKIAIQRMVAFWKQIVERVSTTSKALSVKADSKRRQLRLQLAAHRVRSLMRLQARLRGKVSRANHNLALAIEATAFETNTVSIVHEGFGNRTLRALRSKTADEILITMGALIALFVVWFLFINDTIQGTIQEDSARGLVYEWREDAGLPDVESVATGPSSDSPPVLSPPQEGVAFATLYVPRFGEDFVRVIAEGTDLQKVLNSRTRGVGRYTESDPIGSVGNFAIAAHRTTWGAAFGEIGELRLGDKIYVETSAGWYVYGYRNSEYVWDSEVDVLNSFPKLMEEAVDSRIITLTSCHPKFSEAERIVAYGIFEGWYPREKGAPPELANMIQVSN